MSPLPDPPDHEPFERQLCSTLRTWRLEPAVYEPVLWANLADLDPTRLHHPYGWLPPSPHCWAGTKAVPCCPKIIEHQTSRLPNESRGRYLAALAMSAATHVGFESLPVNQRSAAVYSHLYDTFPDVLRMLTEVSMSVLDDLVAPPGH